MRIVIRLIALVGLGLACGVGLAVFEYGGWPATGAALASPTSIEARAALSVPVTQRPRALVQSVDFDFGTMERGTTRTHEFPIKNDGYAPLTLEQAGTSCSCTLSGLDTDSLPPGQTAQVKLTWTGGSAITTFRHWAKIKTNDPSAPVIEFVIHGKILESIEVEPQLVRFDKPAESDWSTDIRVFSRVLPDLQLTGYELEDAATAEQFAVELQPITSTDSEIKSQWSVKVTVKPGLPSGRIQQKIRLRTNFADRPEVEVTVAGAVESDLRVFGARWNQTAGALKLGQIEFGQGAVGELKVLVQGEHRNRVKLRVKQVVPAFLQVQIGDPQALAGGERLQFPVKIIVPTDAPATSFLGSGVSPYAEVILETDHPEQSELTIKVGFSISR